MKLKDIANEYVICIGITNLSKYNEQKVNANNLYSFL